MGWLSPKPTRFAFTVSREQMDCHLPNIASTSPGRSDGEKSSRYQQDSKEIVAMMLDQLYDPSACEKASKCYFESTITPPITMDSLSELHMSSILSNGKLRHDLNFDKNLILRPNLNGRTGEKEEAQTSYWAAVTVELRLYAGIHEGSFTDVSEPTMFRACQLRIPPMFKTIKDILGTLVLEADRAQSTATWMFLDYCETLNWVSATSLGLRYGSQGC